MFIVLGFSCKTENKVDPISLKNKEIQKRELNKKYINKIFLDGVWAEEEEENALFIIAEDSIRYVDNMDKSYLVKLHKDTLVFFLKNFKFKGEILKLTKDSLIYKGDSEIIKLYKRNK